MADLNCDTVSFEVTNEKRKESLDYVSSPSEVDTKIEDLIEPKELNVEAALGKNQL